MAVAELTGKVRNLTPNLGGKAVSFNFVLVTQNDWIIFEDPIGYAVATYNASGVPTAITSITNASSDAAAEVASATATTLTGATFTVNQRPASGYLLVGTEIVKYSGATKSSATGTLTLDARGCFGTTAAIHSSATAYVLNTLVFDSTAGRLISGIAKVLEE